MLYKTILNMSDVNGIIILLSYLNTAEHSFTSNVIVKLQHPMCMTRRGFNLRVERAFV